mmetsp:Transcript_7150/g.20200  ORF Transcript_7150/g.20200 Transcript_7150/m.20200 type:complete len:343 (+) Transcript_7150:174-1202(+)|eukprot:CAMPEP_0117648474 /NCGR_PEP_ID=MMETSP0804-20121206/424_1 /TAXON_ID=1074897 /ORGANISM="Tetraselmis astigmatica, Strain CCMP880" /LENGTH=342 /DNA_ID=CAMNT_0005454079 /DNA_START=144 /DNA_END=1172 /DNA_ORIENTATION=-
MSSLRVSVAAALALCFFMAVTVDAIRPLYSCSINGTVVLPGETSASVPCSSVYHSSTCGADKILTCRCELGQWTDCEDTERSNESTDLGVNSTDSTAENNETETIQSADGMKCTFDNREYSVGATMARMAQDGIFQRCSCASPGEWECTPVTSLSCDVNVQAILDELINNSGVGQSCRCIAGQWECGTDSSTDTKNDQSGPCLPGAQRETTSCNNDSCSTELCVCSASGQYLCQPAGSDRDPGGNTGTGGLLGTCTFQDFEVPVGFEFETSRNLCKCVTAGGPMDCQLKEVKASCEYLGLDFPDQSTRGESHSDANGVVTSEKCVCNDGAWDCQQEVGPSRL